MILVYHKSAGFSVSGTKDQIADLFVFLPHPHAVKAKHWNTGLLRLG